MPHHMVGAYDGFDSLAEVKHHYRRCRTRKHFILSKTGVDKDKPTCPCCGKPVTNEVKNPGYDGNLCEYSPRTKKTAVMHYLCAWGHTMNLIYKFADHLR